MPQKNQTESLSRLAIQKTYKLYVDGKFPRSESGRTTRFTSASGDWAAHVSRASKKDFRDAVTAARAAFPKWSQGTTAYNRGQIAYRIAEMLETRTAQFIEELTHQGSTPEDAQKEVAAAVDRLVYFAGWSDKFQQVFSSVNPVSGPYFNFSTLEPTGVVAALAPEGSALLGLVSVLAPLLVGGNTCVILGSESKPLCAVTLGEVLNSSDVPPGVVNLLTGSPPELAASFASHMDVNSVLSFGLSPTEVQKFKENASLNLKRVVTWSPQKMDAIESPYSILDFQEVKTTWHPIGT
jgi:acyl-CoA reductase-like NAD-dependent aldehyde dehydrogenase